jgi:predicted  nucleic acid-binding Zn-ribbon protein
MNQEITLEKIYNVVLKLDTRMDRLEIKVDRIEVRLDKMDERISRLEEDMHDLLDSTRITFTNHEIRLATLELA